ncbi:glycerol-3-phosphate dehydrogenase/oxidase [Rhodococcoides kyotonense]|uniref:Glycerol-3-phosphate dehydrogenase n=1 Tax=Rhodococcoides kyotonense TaxID=398843 RepID=A0A239D1U9_9NOCA|nr:glycerol-3-phosphate dehydrogenase/oxidase [Rhodococcus kyotonensis]SNS26277.1 glycerol-3-phosphate dehydrogenase [Rhodococcus kyotonensis]
MIPAASARLDGERRRRELDALFGSTLFDGAEIDVLVVGGGITGAGIALDAATRGLRVVLVDKHDLAFGTSRWSSKLVHGGLRYLASGNVAIAHESAVERGILMTRTAPHLIRPLAQVVPLLPGVSRSEAAVVRAGFLAGDVLRRAAGTSAAVLPNSRSVDADVVTAEAPTVLRHGLRGGLMAWDGQLVDDARLVVAVARTAALHGASILTGVSASNVDRTSATLTDEDTGASTEVRARIVVNATGVWAGQIDPRISLRPSRGTHLVFERSTFGGLTSSLTIPIPGERNRFVFALPAPLDRVYVGLTDVAADGPIPDEPRATDSEIEFLLDVLGTAVDPAPTLFDVVGTFAGLRPLLDSGGKETADVSRRHAILDDGDGPISAVGGKLTTYRRMAEHAVDAAVSAAGASAGPCRTASIPLVGAGAVLGPPAPDVLVRRYGSEASLVVALAESVPGGALPVADGIDVLVAETEFAVRYEGARTVADLLDRRTRIGLVDADRERAVDAATRVLTERHA